MPVTNSICTSFKEEILQGIHQLADTYKLALIKEDAAGTYGSGMANYAELSSDEVTGSGYTAGGIVLSGIGVGSFNESAWLDWDDPAWTDSSIDAIGGVIYNASRNSRTLCVLTFGGVITSVGGNFSIVFPSSHIIRLN